MEQMKGILVLPNRSLLRQSFRRNPDDLVVNVPYPPVVGVKQVLSEKISELLKWQNVCTVERGRAVNHEAKIRSMGVDEVPESPFVEVKKVSLAPCIGDVVSLSKREIMVCEIWHTFIVYNYTSESVNANATLCATPLSQRRKARVCWVSLPPSAAHSRAPDRHLGSRPRFNVQGKPGQLSRPEEPKSFPRAIPISPPASPIDKTSARQSSASRRSIEPGYLNTLYAMNSTPAKTPRAKPRRLNFCSDRRWCTTQY